MTTLDDLVQLVELHPDNPICCAMLVDELMDARGMLRSEADAHVERVKLVAVAAAELTHAAELLRPTARSCRVITDWIYAMAEAPRRARPTILMVPGDHTQTIAHPADDAPNSYWGHAVVTIGAKQVVGFWAGVCATRKAQRVNRLNRHR